MLKCPTAVIADKIKHIHFQKESKNLFLPTISVLNLCSQSAQPFQPLAILERGLAGHPQCINVGNDYSKTRLYNPIRLKTTTLPRCARHHSAQRERWNSSPPKTTLTPQSFLQGARMPWPTNGPAFRPMLSPSHSATAGTQVSQGTTAQADSNSPSLVGLHDIPVLR